MASKNAKLRATLRLPPEEEPEFQIAPMIDILLVLLVFFMSISSTEVLQKQQGINLPVAKDAKEPDKGGGTDGQIVVNIFADVITKEPSIQLGEQKYQDPEAAMPAFKTAVEAAPEVRILIRADKEVRYEYIKRLLRSAGGGGIKNVTFSVIDKEEKK